jgi:hypothetical protein
MIPDLGKVTIRAHPDLERVERLHLLELIGSEEGLAEGMHAQIDHPDRELAAAESTGR